MPGIPARRPAPPSTRDAQPSARHTAAAAGPPLDRTCCPEPGCPQSASVSDRFVLESTEGPVEHAALRCGQGHAFRMPTALLRRAG